MRPRIFHPLDIEGTPAVSNCKYLGDEPLNGVPAAAYSYERFRLGSKAHVRMWISKQTGLPVQSHIEFVEPESAEAITTFAYDSTVAEPDLGAGQ